MWERPVTMLKRACTYHCFYNITQTSDTLFSECNIWLYIYLDIVRREHYFIRVWDDCYIQGFTSETATLLIDIEVHPRTALCYIAKSTKLYI